MSTSLLIVLLLLAAAVVMFVVNRPRMDAVALIMIVAMPFTGVVTIGEALAGFSDPSIVLIAALFVIGEGLVRTGVARHLGDWLDAKARGSEVRLLVLLMLVVAGLGAFMSSTAVVAIFIPVVLRICQNTGTPPRRLMMPLSVAALISGMMTLVATAPNLVVDAELRRQGAAGFQFFSFTPFGVPILILGILYMLLARRLLAGGADRAGAARRQASLRDWIGQYGLAGREHRVRVMPGSPLIGRRVGDYSDRLAGVNLLAIERGHRFRHEVVRPTPRTEFQVHDILLVDVMDTGLGIEALQREYGVAPLALSDGAWFADKAQEIGLVEVILPTGSSLAGQTVPQARVRADYGLTAIGLRRGQTVFGAELREEKLKVGDTLLLAGFWPDIRRLQSDTADFVVLALPAEMQEVLPAASRAPQAVAVLVLTVGLMVSGVVANVHAALIGCLLMGLFRCVDLNSAYRAINWQSLVLIVGMLPFSLALQRTGGVDLAAEALLAAAGNASPRTMLAILFVITASLGLFISNTATAVLMAPVALAVAKDLGASPYPFAMIVALAASTAFMTPISSPVNTLVVGPGNYAFADFVRVGVPFSIIVMAASLVLVPWLMPFH
ncbi:SLC13 family permease [Roseomonas sp. NAR14]|uniref:SLC13 family permease n=1 Tax=Roseomonas acroporae TaxID=2937791 RepID=A0A9X1Y4X4_9PROT|nr:SLC13 family permease [Roseomonas acroporae]MCK8784294.1 SLC13 family permease [Roseomonas acroporae]